MKGLLAGLLILAGAGGLLGLVTYYVALRKMFRI